MKSSDNFECIPLQWDSDYFGISSARVRLNGNLEEEDQQEIINFCKEYNFVTISNIDNIDKNNYWIAKKTNAFLADVNIQFVKYLKRKDSSHVEENYVTNNLTKNSQILEIAKKAFRHSRFFNDSKLPTAKARSIYVYWTQCAFNQENKFFVVSEKEGNIAGYILFNIKNDSSVIELIGVDEKYQGRGIGRSLIQSMEEFLINKGIYKITVGTQINNISAAQFYSKIGFKYSSCTSTYHLWNR